MTLPAMPGALKAMAQPIQRAPHDRELGGLDPEATLVTYQADISLIYQSCPDTGFIRLIRPDTPSDTRLVSYQPDTGLIRRIRPHTKKGVRYAT